jgi:hypothetical protein
VIVYPRSADSCRGYPSPLSHQPTSGLGTTQSPASKLAFQVLCTAKWGQLICRTLRPFSETLAATSSSRMGTWTPGVEEGKLHAKGKHIQVHRVFPLRSAIGLLANWRPFLRRFDLLELQAQALEAQFLHSRRCASGKTQKSGPGRLSRRKQAAHVMRILATVSSVPFAFVSDLSGRTGEVFLLVFCSLFSGSTLHHHLHSNIVSLLIESNTG